MCSSSVYILLYQPGLVVGFSALDATPPCTRQSIVAPASTGAYGASSGTTVASSRVNHETPGDRVLPQDEVGDVANAASLTVYASG